MLSNLLQRQKLTLRRGAVALLGLFAVGCMHAQEISLDLGGGVKMEFVWVPVGGSDGRTSVQIGDQSGAHEKEPVRTETLWGPFQQAGRGFGYYLGKTEVTEEQWFIVTAQGRRSQMPATGKTFLEIQSFIEAINAKSGQFASFPCTGDGSPGVIRLPTETEWEYAARGGAGPDYGASDPYKGDIERLEVFSVPGSSGHAREVAGFPPNQLGLCDMLGNVREFVEGSYAVGGMVGGLLLKGGSYTSEKSEIRSSARTEQPRTGKASRRLDAGFRLCISADVYTSLGQAAGVKGKLKSEKEKTEKSEAMKAEEAKLDERVKQAEADAAKAREESERLTQDAAMAAKRKSLELAEKKANEEKAKLEALKRQLANGGTLPPGNATSPVEGAAPSAPTLSSDTKKATKESPFENSLGMKFVPVPGTDVLFSVWDTRVKDFRAYAEAARYRQTGGIYVWDGSKWGLDANASWENPGFQQMGYHPVVGVSWDEAKAFCKWLTAKERGEGKILATQEYRLPTDAEWSVAVGSGKYPWGNEWPPPKGAGNYDPSLGVDSYVNTSPCGNLSTNQLGLCDMGGNVWQWCEDWYRAGMNESALLEKYAFLKDDGGGQKYRVVRGGSWNRNNPEPLLSSFRFNVDPGFRYSSGGFRCVLGSSR